MKKRFRAKPQSRKGKQVFFLTHASKASEVLCALCGFARDAFFADLSSYCDSIILRVLVKTS
jgi:hypothetical protein